MHTDSRVTMHTHGFVERWLQRVVLDEQTGKSVTKDTLNISFIAVYGSLRVVCLIKPLYTVLNYAAL